MEQDHLSDLAGRVGSRLLILLAIGLPLVVNPLGIDPFAVPKVVLLYIVALALVGAWLLQSIAVARLTWRSTPADRPLLMLGVVYLLVTVASAESVRSYFGRYEVLEGLLAILAYFIVFFAATNLVTTKRRWRAVVVAIMIGAGATALYALVEQAGWVSVSRVPGTEAQTRAIGTLADPVSLGMLMALVLPLLAGWVMDAEAHPRGRVAAGIGGLAVAGALAAGNARAAWIGAAAGLILLAALKVRGARAASRAASPAPTGASARASATSASGPSQRVLWAMPFAVLLVVVMSVGAMAVVLHGPAVGGRLASVVSSPVEQLGGRGFAWSVTARMVADRPLTGFGADSVGVLWPLYRPRDWLRHNPQRFATDNARNDALSVAQAVGLIGLLAYAAFLASTIWFGLRQAGRLPGRAGAVAGGLVAGCVAYLVAVQVQSSTIQVTPIFYLMAGLLFASARLWPAGGEAGRPPAPPPESALRLPLFVKREARLWAGGITLVLLLTGVYHAMRPLQADMLARRALAPQIQSDSGAVRGLLARAAAANPYQEFYREILAGYYQEAGQVSSQPAYYDAVRDSYLQLLALNSYKSEAYVALGDLEFDRSVEGSRMAVAASYYRRGLAVDPFSPVLLGRLGAVNARRGLLGAAQGDLTEAVAIDPKDPQLAYNLAGVYRDMGQRTAAARWYRRTLRLNPKYPDAREALKEVTGGR